MQARLLLIHSPLVGCRTWEPVARDLTRDGYAVTVPDLAGTVAAGPPYHLRQAKVIAGSAAGQPVILIGHSRAGPLLAAAGTMLGEAVQGYVFIDARLPAPGRSWMETVTPGLAARLREMADPQGRLPPWSRWWGEEAGGATRFRIAQFPIALKVGPPLAGPTFSTSSIELAPQL